MKSNPISGNLALMPAVRLLLCSIVLLHVLSTPAAQPSLEVRQLTFGPRHHFFGYIGHVRTIPWNRSGRYIVALEADFQDRMPGPADAARIVLLDTQANYAVRVIEQTRAWNPQQGTMLYWNPEQPETQFFFNDRDPRTGKVFCVLFDISAGERGRRLREYRFEDTPVGNSGVAQNGGHFAAINYARMARLRPVTGYPEAWDWTAGVHHPDNDGVFRVQVRTGRKELLVSFSQLAAALRAERPDIDERALFINHTLWSRSGDRIFFFVRADFGDRDRRVNASFVIRPDGTGLSRMKQHIGGHPEWAEGSLMIGALDGRQVLYDVERQGVAGTLGHPGIFPNPEGDIALSPDGTWLVNGSDAGGSTYYTFFRRADSSHVRSRGFDRGGWTSGDLRIDPAPCWNRDGTAILFPSVADDPARTRQIFMIRLPGR